MSSYLANQFTAIKEVEDEQDVLMLKKAQAKVIYYYKLWQMPFIGMCGLYSIRIMTKSKRSLPLRMGLTMFVGTLCIFSNHYVGQYGLQRNIEPIFNEIISDKNIERQSKIALEANEFLS